MDKKTDSARRYRFLPQIHVKGRVSGLCILSPAGKVLFLALFDTACQQSYSHHVGVHLYLVCFLVFLRNRCVEYFMGTYPSVLSPDHHTILCFKVLFHPTVAIKFLDNLALCGNTGYLKMYGILKVNIQVCG